MSDYQKRVKLMESLYDQYSAAFYGEICRTFFYEKICNEVLLNAYMRIWRNLEQLAPKENTFIWCFRIVRKEIEMRKVEILLKEIFACQHSPHVAAA